MAVFFDIWIDETTLVAFVFGLIVTNDVEVYDRHTDWEAYLGGCKSYASAVFEGLPHILDDLGEVGIVRGNLLGLFLEDGLSVGVDG